MHLRHETYVFGHVEKNPQDQEETFTGVAVPGRSDPQILIDYGQGAFLA